LLTTLLQLISRSSSTRYERAFIREVEVKDRMPRNPWMERLLLVCWLLIVIKCFFVIWAVNRWSIPFSPYWIILPTILMAALCTAVYYWRD
jgi:hypothetical protein